jgi:hypothetical protein
MAVPACSRFSTTTLPPILWSATYKSLLKPVEIGKLCSLALLFRR